MPRSSFRSRVTHVLTGLGIAFTSFLLVLGMFLAFLTFAKIVRAFMDAQFDAAVTAARNAAAVPAPLPKVFSPRESAPLPPSPSPSSSSSLSSSSPPNPSEELIFASYSDLFSGVGGIDQKQTSMYRDDWATAFLFPPDLAWTEVSGESSGSGFPFPVVTDSKSCIGNSCLAVKGAVLTLDGAVVPLPFKTAVQNVTAEAMGDEWLVGIVQKEDTTSTPAQYAGYAYRFDGRHFAPLFPEEKAFESNYEGKWEFGGTPDDFLAVYGAYEGKGYRFREKSSLSSSSFSSSPVDLSWLFGVRIMRGGITPGILRVGEGNHATWYLFNKERNNRPVFVKLFQNGTDEIVGEANLLGTAPQSFSYIAVSGSRSPVFPFMLSVYAESNGVASTWEVQDKGFVIPPGPVTVASVNLNNYQAEVPHIIKSDFREFSAGGAKIALSFSNAASGEGWEPVQLVDSQSLMAGDYWFKDPHGTALRWKMTVTPGKNPEFSPFIGILDLDYEVKR